MRPAEYQRKVLNRLFWIGSLLLAGVVFATAWFGFAGFIPSLLGGYLAFFLLALMFDEIVRKQVKDGAGATIATYEFVDAPPDENDRRWPILILPAILLASSLLMENGITKLTMVGVYLPMIWAVVDSYLVSRFPHRKDDDQIRRRAGVACMIGGALIIASHFLRAAKQVAPIFLQIYLPICGIVYMAIGIVMWTKRSVLTTQLRSNVLELRETAIQFERASYPWENIQSVEKHDKGTHVLFKLWAIPLRIFGELNRPGPRPIRFMISVDESHQFVEHLVRHAKQAKFKGELRIVSADLNARPIEFIEA